MMRFIGTGSEQYGYRPGLVFQNNVGNKYSPNVIVLPLTTNLKRIELPTHVLLRAEVTGLLRDSIVLCENPQRISKEKIGTYITKLSDSHMSKVAEASLMATSAISYLDKERLIRAWHRSIQLNAA